MYSEVREIVNFIARYICGSQPRRATGNFTAELANLIVKKYAQTGWNTNNPSLDEESRILFINCDIEGTTDLIEAAARESDLDYGEILSFLPANLRICANPGYVFFLFKKEKIPIWFGDVNSDRSYHPIPEYIAAVATTEAQKRVGEINANTPFANIIDKGVIELVNGYYVPLTLAECNQADSFTIFNKKFIFKPHSSQTFTGAMFSQTRFGSARIREDLEALMKLKEEYDYSSTSSQ